MRTIGFLIQKEFIQIFRNKTLLPLIFAVPILQLVILVNAATLEMKKIDMTVVDKDMTSTSRQLIQKFDGSPFYQVDKARFSVKNAEADLKDNTADIVIHIPHGFEDDLLDEKEADVQFLINAINNTAAGLINAYTTSIISDYNNKILAEQIGKKFELPVEINYRYFFNTQLDYNIYMLPGILVILVTIIGMFLTALNIVREKELGTIEQLNVTPIKKYQFIIGKMLPFMVIALFELAFGLVIGHLFFNLPMEGSYAVLFLFTLVYLLVALGFGLFLSAISNSQQQVMFVMFFFMLTFILMSGIFTPTESMPEWAQTVNVINPFAYFMKVIRMIILKGSGLADIRHEIYSMLIYALIILSLAIWRYRKVA
ncbi:MAG: ABC transporter permease [Bacteroidales bacterium]|nr:ABC transporter permease [Bacteroidales bacterium]